MTNPKEMLIQGVTFTMDEETYRLLEVYLKSIADHFKGVRERDEIIRDIEIRLTELLLQRSIGATHVITGEDVNWAAGIIGEPGQFDKDSSAEESPFSDGRRRQRLYRDMDHRMISGVCSGLGAYFSIDPTIIRLAFVVATVSGLSPLVYIVMWIVMPPARTIAEKLEMHGDPLNIKNIEKALRKEMDDLRERFDDFADKARSTFKR